MVHTTAELVIGLLPEWRFSRQLDSATGYAELQISPHAGTDGRLLPLLLRHLQAQRQQPLQVRATKPADPLRCWQRLQISGCQLPNLSDDTLAYQGRGSG